MSVCPLNLGGGDAANGGVPLWTSHRNTELGFTEHPVSWFGLT